MLHEEALDFPKAISYMERAHELDPTNPSAMNNLAKVYSRSAAPDGSGPTLVMPLDST
jgi:Flp pilus assembly protein TadD